MSKLTSISKSNISLTYDLRGSGELDLMDVEDMATMFILLDEMQIWCVHVFVKRIDGSSAQSTRVANSQSMNAIIKYNDPDLG